MQKPEIGESSVAPEAGSGEGQSRNSLLSLKQTKGPTLNFLSEDFVPTMRDVVCGRGKKCYSHAGNELFKTRVEGVLDEYSRAKSKLDKSGVLNRVVAEVRRASPGGGFVKQDESGRWYEVGDFLAREKTSQAFRDALHERYKSSNVSKKKRRKEVMKFTDKSQMMHNYSEEEGRSKIELSTGIFSHNYAMETQHGLLPFSRSLEPTNESNSNLNPGFNAPGSYYTASVLPPLGTLSAELHTMDAFGNRSFSVGTSHHLGGTRLANSALFAANQRAFQLVFEGEGSSTNFRSLPDMRCDINASAPTFREQMHHSLPNLHLGYNPESARSVLAAPTRYDTQLQAFRNQTSSHARVERHQGQPHSNRNFSLEFEPEFGFQSQPMNPGAPLLNAPPAEASRAKKIRVADSRKSKKSSAPDDQEFLQCLDKLTEYKLSDDNPYEPVPLGRNRQNPA